MEDSPLPRVISIGTQDFGVLRRNDYFYVDKTRFLREWWLGASAVTLITRPSRFGKTLMLSTARDFFSNSRSDQASLFSGLDVWKSSEMRLAAGRYPVVSLSFASVKSPKFSLFQNAVIRLISDVWQNFAVLSDSPRLTSDEKRLCSMYAGWKAEFLTSLSARPTDEVLADAATAGIRDLCRLLYKHYGCKAVVLLDEYDTPLQEAWLNHYWDEAVPFVRQFMNATFKDNEYLERGLLTGITRVSKESIFSDLNNIDVITPLSERYADAFGFTEPEVVQAMREFGLNNLSDVKSWYDGFSFGRCSDIYNPWSITNYLSLRKFDAYWANTSSNALAGSLIRTADSDLKTDFEALLRGASVVTELADAISFRSLSDNPSAIWSLLLSAGYIKVLRTLPDQTYEISLTNDEIRRTFKSLIREWFVSDRKAYDGFLKALINHDLDFMNEYLSRLTMSCFSYFDVGSGESERFYHGFILGLVSSLEDRFIISSNRESGFGRYDLILEPRDRTIDDAFILEFKVRRRTAEPTLADTVKAALHQIRERCYGADLIERGIAETRIHRLGIAFDGKSVLIGTDRD